MADDSAARLSAHVGAIATAWEGSFGRDTVTMVEGHDHDVVLVGTEAVFRFPRHERAYAALAREVAALTLLDSGPVRDVLPTVRYDFADRPYGAAFVGQRYLGGEPLPRGSVEAVGPMAYRFAAELARVLDALAAVEVTDDLRKVLTSAPMRASFEDLWEAVRDRVPSDEADAAFRAVLDLDLPEPALVHGDFTGRNLRWDADETRLTGVLDWGQVHLGDPAYEIASLADTYGWDLAATVDAATASEDDSVMARARAYAATFPFQVALAAS